MNGNDLRTRLASGGPVLMPGVWDALSARLAANAGFDVVFQSGYAVSGTLLGRPDFGYVTQVEQADVARRVCDANRDVMVVVDGDTGYGNALNVIRTVELWEAAGAAGVFIEDQVWPKRCGHMAGKLVVPTEDWLAKLRAACDARRTLHVTARTDARAAVSLDEAIERAKMARDCGVDALFVEAPQSAQEMEVIASALDGITLVANMVEAGRTPLLTPSELAQLGFTLIVSPVSLLFAATKAMQRTAAHLRDEGTMREHLDELCGFDEFGTIVGLPDAFALEARYAR